MPESTYGNKLRKKNTPLALQPVDPVRVLLGQHYREQFPQPPLVERQTGLDLPLLEDEICVRSIG